MAKKKAGDGSGKKSGKRKGKQPETAVELPVEQSESAIYQLPLTDHRWAPSRLRVFLREEDFDDEAATRQLQPMETPWPSLRELGAEVSDLVHKGKIKKTVLEDTEDDKGKKVFGLSVTLAILDKLVENWQTRPVSNAEAREALRGARKEIDSAVDHNRDVDFRQAKARLAQAEEIFHENLKRRESSKLDWRVVKGIARNAQEMAHTAVAEWLAARIRRRVVGNEAAQTAVEQNIEYKMSLFPAGKRLFELREFDRNLDTDGWKLK